jgi:hypothetical protein
MNMNRRASNSGISSHKRDKPSPPGHVPRGPSIQAKVNNMKIIAALTIGFYVVLAVYIFIRQILQRRQERKQPG